MLSVRLSRTKGERRWELVTSAIAETVDAGGDLDEAAVVDGTEVTDMERILNRARPT